MPGESGECGKRNRWKGTDAGGYLRLFAYALAEFKIVKIKKLNVSCGLKHVREMSRWCDEAIKGT